WASEKGRQASVHQRGSGGLLAPIEFGLPEDPEFHMGGGGLHATAHDYLAFAMMIMLDGRGQGGQVLRPETVALMAQNHIGPLEVGPLKTVAADLSNDVELFPGISKKWGLSFLINAQPLPTGRSAGRPAWARPPNPYFSIHP